MPDDSTQTQQTQQTKTFTQDELNGILAKERRGLEAKIAELTPLAEKAKQVDDLAKKISELEQEKELAGKDAATKEKILAEQAAKRIAAEREQFSKERDEHKARADKAESEFKAYRNRSDLGAALVEAKVYGPSLEDAIKSFADTATIERGEDGTVTAVRFEGVSHKDPKAAAEAFLKSKPWFAAASEGGGTGTRTSANGGRGAPAGKPLHELSSDERWALAQQNNPWKK